MELKLHSHQFTEDNVKKAYFSPVTSLLVSFSLALGILVGDLGGAKLLTSVHAQENPCGWTGNNATLTGDSVNIEDGLILSGITVRDVVVDGVLLEQAVIAGSVRLTNATVTGTTGTIFSNGVIVGGDGGSNAEQTDGPAEGGEGPNSPCYNGVIVGGDDGNGDNTVGQSGVIVGGSPASGEDSLGGATPDSSATAVGGTLTGDNIAINDGVITGENLLLSGATIDGGSLNGITTSVSVSPAD
jgi:hypothetical protein